MAASSSNKLTRLLRHRLGGKAAARRAFPQTTVDAVARLISEGEQTHRGELRLIVEKGLPADLVLAGVDCRRRALALFAEYAIWDTEENCGVLVYVNLADRQVEIVADRGINRKIDAATWRAVCTTMTEGFRRGDFHHSTLAAIGQINALLQTHFPANGARPNELPDAPVML